LVANPLDNQLTKSESSLQRAVLIALAILSAVLLVVLGVYTLRVSDPYIKSVLTATGDPIQGHAIFQMNCSGCHGLAADGKVGPSLHGISERKSRVGLIEQVISGKTPPMPQFQPSAQEMADLLSYLESL
jgi:mono/diheme cytochrome c family protein